MAKSFYVLRAAVKTRLEPRGVAFNCWRCGKPIKVGEEVVSTITARSSRKLRHFYHKECWESMFI